MTKNDNDMFRGNMNFRSGRPMNHKTHLYDIGERLQHAVLTNDMSRVADIAWQIEGFLQSVGFKQASYWLPNSEDWKPKFHACGLTEKLTHVKFLKEMGRWTGVEDYLRKYEEGSNDNE